jgi:putative ABC transport system permease protein
MRDWKAEMASRLPDPSDVREDVVEEVAQHLEARYDALIGRGFAEDRAYAETLQELADSTVFAAMLRPDRQPPPAEAPALELTERGAWPAAADTSRKALVPPTSMWIDHIRQDLRIALRSLWRTPAFTIGAVLPLALGLAIATCAVAVMNAYLLRSQPYPASDRVYHVRYAPPGPWEPNNLRQLDWAAAGDVIEFPLASSAETFLLSDGRAGAQPLRGRRVSYGVVAGLDLRMTAGRPFVEGDFLEQTDQAVLIAARVWRERFGSDPAALGQSIATETEAGRRERFRIAGVLPEEFYIGGESRQPIDIVVPFTAPVRTYYLLRLREGVPPAAVETRLTGAVRAVSTDLPTDWTGVQLESAHDRYAGQLRPVLLGVTSAAALLLLIVCANVAVLTLLRAIRRQREVSIRLALGSSRARLARMLATEACAIGAVALALGLAGSHVALGLLAPRIEVELGRPAPNGTASIGVDPTVLAIVGGMGLVLALALALVPLLVAGRVGLADVLRRTSTATTDGRSTARWRSAMLASEVAVTLVLFVGCGLMVRSVVAMVRTDLGFEPEMLTRARIALRAADYPDGPAFSRFFEAFTRRASTRTGFPLVFSSWPVFAEFPEHAIEIDGRAGHVASAGAVRAGPGYFGTMGIRLRSGRDFTWDDRSGASPAAVISESLAQRLWPGESPLGRRVRQVERTAGGDRPPGPWQTIVGVAADVRQTYGDRNRGDIYTPWLPDVRFGSFFLRSGGREADLLPVLRATAAEIDPRAVVDLFHAVHEDNRELAGTTFLGGLLACLATVAACLAVIGIYAVTAYATEQREREVAIRMALGADRRAVIWLFVRQGCAVLIGGLALGVPAAVAMARVLGERVFAVSVFDAPTLAGMGALLAVSGLVATWWPARRASRRNPIGALKQI